MKLTMALLHLFMKGMLPCHGPHPLGFLSSSWENKWLNMVTISSPILPLEHVLQKEWRSLSQRAHPPYEFLPPHDTHGAVDDICMKLNGIKKRPKPPHEHKNHEVPPPKIQILQIAPPT